MKRGKLICCTLALFLLAACLEDDSPPVQSTCTAGEMEAVPINELQVIASHNSYRKRTTPAIFNLVSLGSAVLPDEWIPEDIDPAVQWDYHHEPLPAQFNQFNVRSIELDLYNDPEGGLYATRLLNALVGLPVEVNIPALHQPGIKVMHIAHMDYETHYLTFRRALTAIGNWSEAHPGHFPLYVMMEMKDRSFPFEIPDLVQPFNETNNYRIADEILEVLPREKLITPEDLRTQNTLQASIQADGWPTLGEARGKLFFIVMGADEISGTVFGSNSSLTDHAEHIFKIRNNPVGEFTQIQSLVNQGFMVRTRADAGTMEARSGDTEPRDMAMLSGAQIITTDYYRPDYRYLIFPNAWTDYCVQWPGDHVARSNQDPGCYVHR